MNEWISIEDLIPQWNTKVLVQNTRKEMFTAYLNHKTTNAQGELYYWYEKDSSENISNITHWQYLPTPAQWQQKEN